MSKKYNIELIVGLDSHYIYENDAQERDYVLAAKNIHYEDEEGWFMDYPDDNTVMKRFLQQGIFTQKQIQRAMDNTDICLSFDNYDNVYVFSKEIKLPTLYLDLTKEEKDKKYSRLITKKFKEYMKNVPSERYNEYFEGVKKEVETYKDTGMVDYPLIDYAIVQDAVNNGGLITDTGRGSAVGYFTNTLCGFSKVDRFTSAIKLYPERFISKTRILETHSLPDIDLNVGTPEIFEQAQINVLGEDHVAPMIAFGTFKKKSAFKLYARAKGLNFDIANEISEQIGKYEDAVKYADDDEKDEIDLYDYVDKKYESYIKASEKYWGIISDKKKAPSAYLLYQGNIRKEIGLIKCKSESSKNTLLVLLMELLQRITNISKMIFSKLM
jgi:DNA polymerase III alpha subunit